MQQERGKKSGRSTQKPEKLGDNGKEDSSTKGRTRHEKGHREFEFQRVCVEKERKRQMGKTLKIGCAGKKNERKPKLIGQQRVEGTEEHQVKVGYNVVIKLEKL